MGDIKKVIKENRSYLLKAWNGIVKGELEHRQDDYVCGAARCLLGWAEELKVRDRSGEPPIWSCTQDFVDYVTREIAWIESFHTHGSRLYHVHDIYSTVAYGLEMWQADELFGAEPEPSDQYSAMCNIFDPSEVENPSNY